METIDRKTHWEKIYETKETNQCSWYQAKPETSLYFLNSLNLPKSTAIIDVGGGDSFFVDYLLATGYSNITVLDISERAINRAKNRLGVRGKQVEWIVADASAFEPTRTYDFWHDRAAFHFLTDEEDVSNYLQIAAKSLNANGTLVLGTFSEHGPKKCSGIEIKQYSKDTMTKCIGESFELIDCLVVDHKSPSDLIQNFLFCSFRKLDK